MDEKQRMTRNLNQQREAKLAMIVWGKEYSEQRGGSMDFWDKISESRQKLCIEWCTKLEKTERK